MYNKNIRNNPRSILWNFEDILTIGQILAKSSTIEQDPCARAKFRFSANIGIFWNTQDTFLEGNQKFLQYICPMYFLKNRNYDLFKLMFLPRGFVQSIRIQGLITPAN